MPNWKKVVVSGSSPELSDVQVSTFGDSPGSYGTVSHLSSSIATRIASTEGGSVANVDGSDYIDSTRAGSTETISIKNNFIQAVSGSTRGILSGSYVKDVGGGVSGSAISTGSFGRLEVLGTGSISGDLVIGGNITIGDGNTDNISIGGEFNSNLVPDTTNTFDLGTLNKSWNRLMINQITASGDISGSGTSTGSFGHLLVNGTNVNALSAGQIRDIGAGIVSSSAEGDGQGQVKINDVNVNINDLGTDDSPTFSALTVSNNLNVNGNLDVNGTLTTIDSANLRVADRFILAASGSTSGDGGLVVNTNNAGSGSAFFYDDSAVRWGLTGQNETGGTQITATPRQYVTTVSQSSGAPTGNPSDFGNDTASRGGLMYIDTATGEIYIYS